jgi:hypothetical protein
MNNLMSNPGVEAAREAELERLFANVPVEVDTIVNLPSRGKFYKDFKEVKVLPLLFEDEQRILTAKGRDSNPINNILSKCVKGIPINDLIIADKLYLLLKIKEISYGPEYKFSIICPKCESNVDTVLDVNKHMPVNYAPDELTDPREVTLPILKVKARVRFPRIADEQYTMDVDSAIQNLYRFVVSINGNEDIVFISKALKKMHIRDIKTLMKEIKRDDVGVNSSFQFECPHCNHKDIMGVPFDANFFSVS